MDRRNILAETFRQEAHELLTDIENALLDLEKDPHDKARIHRLFRSMHTLKGSGAMFGFDGIVKLAHHAETLLDNLREGSVPVTGELVDSILLVKDQIKAMLNTSGTGYGADRIVTDKIISKLNGLLPESGEKGASPFPEMRKKTDKPFGKENETVYRIRFRPDPNMMRSGMDPIRLIDEFHGLGHCELMANIEGVPNLEDLAEPDRIYLSWDIILTTDAGINAVRDVFIFVNEESEIAIESLKNGGDTLRPRLGEILVERGDVGEDRINEILGKRKRLGEMLIESGYASEADINSALMEQKILEKRRPEIETETIRINSEKLDKLINLVGEIVITQAHMSHLAEYNENTDFLTPVKQMERLTGDLRQFALDLRMLPVGILFNRFRRLVRDLSFDLGKEVELEMEGDQTELDKTILEKLHDPLIHLIRNSIDHGIRHPKERELAGRSGKGSIRLTAAHQGARVNITVADDGAGIDMALVRAKALEQKLIREDDDISNSEIQDLIFYPGFSTVSEVTGVSGRGVGMDVVRQAMNSLGGTIEIDSAQGQGTTFHMSLPLTLAIVEGLHVKADARDFIIPVSQVELCEELKWKQPGHESDTKNMVRLKGELVPFVRLREFFGLPADNRPVEHMAAIQTEHYRIGVVVDEIVGNIQTVIKPLDPIYRQADGISGATVMGDGTVALIIDPRELIRCVKKNRLDNAVAQI